MDMYEDLYVGEKTVSQHQVRDAVHGVWPSRISQLLCNKLVDAFHRDISSEALKEFTCGSCGESCRICQCERFCMMTYRMICW